MQWKIWFERGAHAWLRGEWRSSLNNSTLCVLTTTGRHCLEFVITVIVISTNGPPIRSSTVKIQVALPMRSLLKASVDKALIYQLLDRRHLKRPDVCKNIPKKTLFRWVFDWGINSVTPARQTEGTLLTWKLRRTAFSPLFTIKMNRNVCPQVHTQKAHLWASTIVWQLAAREEECWIGYSCWMLITAFYGVEEITS